MSKCLLALLLVQYYDKHSYLVWEYLLGLGWDDSKTLKYVIFVSVWTLLWVYLPPPFVIRQASLFAFLHFCLFKSGIKTPDFLRQKVHKSVRLGKHILNFCFFSYNVFTLILVAHCPDHWIVCLMLIQLDTVFSFYTYRNFQDKYWKVFTLFKGLIVLHFLLLNTNTSFTLYHHQILWTVFFPSRLSAPIWTGLLFWLTVLYQASNILSFTCF